MKYKDFKEKAERWGCRVQISNDFGPLASVNVYFPHSNFRHYSISTQNRGQLNVLTNAVFPINEELLCEMNKLAMALANTKIENRGDLESLITTHR